MGKNKPWGGTGKEKGGVVFRFELEPNASVPASAHQPPGSLVGQLAKQFPSVGTDVIESVLDASSGNQDHAMSTLTKMMGDAVSQRPPNRQTPPHTRTPATRPLRPPPQLSPHRPRPLVAQSSRNKAPNSVFEALPQDLFLKLLAYFRPVDLLVCASCCRGWWEQVKGALEALKNLDLTSADSVNLAMLRSCPNVQKIRIRGGFRGFLYLPTMPCVRGLTQLKLVTCSELQDAHITQMLCQLSELNSIEIDKCAQVTDHAFSDLYEQRLRIDMGEVRGTLAKLDSLTISNCPNVTGQGLKYVIMALGGAGLSTIKMSNNGMVQAEAVQLAARRLQSLFLRGANSITELILTACDNLEELSIHGSLQLKRVTLEAPALLRLSVTLGKMLQAARLVAPGLTNLNLSGCRILDTLEISSARLQTINMYGCMSIGESNLNGILAPSFGTLEEVCLDGCERVGALIFRAPSMVKLCVKGCKSLGTLKLFNSRSLKEVDVRGCSQLQNLDIDGDCSFKKVQLLGKTSWRQQT